MGKLQSSKHSSSTMIFVSKQSTSLLHRRIITFRHVEHHIIVAEDGHRLLVKAGLSSWSQRVSAYTHWPIYRWTAAGSRRIRRSRQPGSLDSGSLCDRADGQLSASYEGKAADLQARGERSYDIYSRLLKERVIFLGPVRRAALDL